MLDLMTATRGAVFRALKAAIPDAVAPVVDDVPQGTQPPFIMIGYIDSEATGGKSEQVERITVEVVAVYRGGARGKLRTTGRTGRLAWSRRALLLAAVQQVE